MEITHGTQLNTELKPHLAFRPVIGHYTIDSGLKTADGSEILTFQEMSTQRVDLESVVIDNGLNSRDGHPFANRGVTLSYMIGDFQVLTLRNGVLNNPSGYDGNGLVGTDYMEQRGKVPSDIGVVHPVLRTGAIEAVEEPLLLDGEGRYMRPTITIVPNAQPLTFVPHGNLENVVSSVSYEINPSERALNEIPSLMRDRRIYFGDGFAPVFAGSTVSSYIDAGNNCVQIVCGVESDPAILNDAAEIFYGEDKPVGPKGMNTFALGDETSGIRFRDTTAINPFGRIFRLDPRDGLVRDKNEYKTSEAFQEPDRYGFVRSVK